MFVLDIIWYIDLLLGWVGAVVGIWVLADAATRKADAFVAADRLTKPVWLGITAACALVLVLSGLRSWPGAQSLLWLAAVAGALIYLVDVRPQIRGLRGPSGW